MKTKLLVLLFVAATALAVNACGGDDSPVGSEEAGSRSGDAGGAGEASQADPTQSVKESVFEKKQTEKRLDAQAQTAEKNAPGEQTEPGKAGKSSVAGGAQGGKGAATAGSQGERAASGTAKARSGAAETGGSRQTAQDKSRASQSQAGVKRQDVRQAQQALKERGQDPGPIDGVMGPRTRRALREFQKKQGLEQTGALDTATRQKLNIGSSSGAGSGRGSKQ